MANGQADLSAPLPGSAVAPVGAHPSAPLPPATRSRTTAGSVGVLLDGRYRLLQRRTKDGAAATWDGEDDQLLRAVVIHVVSGPTAAEAVDAARRSAAVEDDRLPHLLDVGLERAVDGTALGWVVTERAPGRTLAELLREAPLPAARARALVGEAAALLALAGRSGLHHRRLEPTTVLLTADGAVSVLGLEVAAAAAGAPTLTPAEADREDAEGLVRLLYAALTGLWPAGRCGSLGAAPTGRGGAPVAPGQLAGGVPHDLDALCAAVLGPYREGPGTPAEVAAALAPWGSSTGPVTRTGLGITVEQPWPGAGGLTAPRESTPGDDGAWSTSPVRARLGGGPGLHFSGVGEVGEQVAARVPAGVGAAAPEPAAAAPAGVVEVPTQEVPGHETRASRRAAQRRAEREAAGPAFDALLGPVSGPRPAVPAAVRTPADAPVTPAATSPAPTGPARATPVEARAAVRAPVVQRPPARPSAAVGTARPTSPFDDTDATDWVDAGWGHAPVGARPVAPPRRRDPRGTAASAAPSAASLPASLPTATRSRSRRGLVVGLGVAVALGLAGTATALVVRDHLPQVSGALGIAPSDTSAPGTGAAAAAPDPVASSAAPGSTAAPAAEVTGAAAADPFGDGTENDAAAPRAVDGDPSTAWSSSTYSNAALGNLKRGVGLSLVLGDGDAPSTVTSLSLTTEGTGGVVQVRSSPDGGYEGSTVLATTEAGTGGRAVRVALDEPVTTGHLLLWFTQLPLTPTGYTAVVDDVSAS